MMMNRQHVLAALVVVGLAASAAAMSQPPTGWKVISRADPGVKLQLYFALTQQNTGKLLAELDAVSSPDSARYGQFLTTEEVLDLVAPPRQVSNAVVDYLRQRLNATDVVNMRDVVKARVSVRDIERVFRATIFELRHVESGRKHIGAVGHFDVVPAELRDVVDFVSGIGNKPVLRKSASTPVAEATLTTDSPTYVVPSTLYDIYNYANHTSEGASLALAEFQNYGGYTAEGLAYFQQQTNMVSNTIAQSHNIGTYQPQAGALESQLDVQYGLAAAVDATGWYFTFSGWMYESTTELFGLNERPHVVSESWGWSADDQCELGIGSCSNGETSKQYIERVNVEFAKLGSVGVTVVVCSQDEGAPGSTNPDCDNNESPLNAVYPATSPYVLSVGATMLAHQEVDVNSDAVGSGEAPICEQYPCASAGTEIVCSYPKALITSGGGFSPYVARPSYQDAALNAYLNSGVDFPPAQYFNSSNRAVPDVAALGHNYLISPDGESFERVDGTSASTPVIAGIIATANAARIKANKPVLGFVTPLIYKIAAETPDVFNDITQGNNKCTEQCCATLGYEAAPGWDATTGWGSINVDKFVAAVLAAVE